MDKWLWSVRLFKTRMKACDACNAGKVKIGGINCKPAREVKAGDEIQLRIGQTLKTVRVKAVPKSRISASMVLDYIEDLTPPEEYERVKYLRMQVEHRNAGAGRPTKKDRRQIDCLKDSL